jgi:hypothetical protein
MRASEAREGEKQNESNERARGRGERERRKFGSGEPTDGRTDETDQRTNERMSVWDGVSNQTLDTCDVKSRPHIFFVHLITYQNLDRTVKNFPQKFEVLEFSFTFSFN